MLKLYENARYYIIAESEKAALEEIFEECCPLVDYDDPTDVGTWLEEDGGGMPALYTRPWLRLEFEDPEDVPGALPQTTDSHVHPPSVWCEIIGRPGILAVLE